MGDGNGLPKAIWALILLVFVRAGFLFTLLKYHREIVLLITEQIYSVASTHKGVNQRSKDVTQIQQQRPESPTVTLILYNSLFM